ncbi:MAG: monomethylamine:corrinoid methyltransferase [Dehalococcoidia bacterium]
MIPIIDFQERSLTGPVMKADEFDLEFSMKVREMVRKYDITYNPEELVVDDSTADAVFQAGVDLLAEIGIYHMDTERVVQFTKEEIEQIARERRENPGKHKFGQGKDEITVEYRTGADTRPPTLYSGPWGVAREEWFEPYVQSFVQEETVEALGICAGLGKLGNRQIKAGTLAEIHAGLWEQNRIKEVLEKSGRPGMHLGLLATMSTPAGIMAMIKDGLRGPHNTHIGVHIVPEQKFNWNQLVLAQFCQDRGIVPWQSANSMIGALCRNPEETAVTLIANMLGQMSYGHGPLCSLWASHLDGRAATWQSQWTYSAAARASERNIKIAVGGCASGVLAWTPYTLLQGAAMVALYTASGYTYGWICGNTGIEARYLGEVMRKMAGMERGKANEVIKAIMKAMESHAGEVKGNTTRFNEVYDLDTVQPKQEYIDYLERAKEEMAGCGVPLN